MVSTDNPITHHRDVSVYNRYSTVLEYKAGVVFLVSYPCLLVLVNENISITGIPIALIRYRYCKGPFDSLPYLCQVANLEIWGQNCLGKD